MCLYDQNLTNLTNDTERISQFIIEDIETQDGYAIPELMGMYLENISGCESLSSDEIGHLIIIESKVDELQQLAVGGRQVNMFSKRDKNDRSESDKDYDK